ncbi:hypothetical protein [Mesoplasma melaleucae]|uniref:hypothetical protein n=1 Tax=Mesoplasma melaleucae TaxID=81459 RepID=UPI00047F2125|nr:hypothetical protein [Mesoplasma melaleucae]
MIFQDQGSSLNKRMSVEEVISEGIDNFPQLYKLEEAKMDYVKAHNDTIQIIRLLLIKLKILMMLKNTLF